MSVLDRLEPEGFQQPLSETWNIKEMLAHLAFWEETSLPVINTILRGESELPVEEWYGGTDLELAPDAPWPDADTSQRSRGSMGSYSLCGGSHGTVATSPSEAENCHRKHH